MLEDSVLISAIGLSLAKLLRPLVRLLLKHSFPYSAFESIAKRVYVETAMEGLRATRQEALDLRVRRSSPG